jgi:hypothetical protein
MKNEINYTAAAVLNVALMTHNVAIPIKAAAAMMSKEDQDQELVQDLESRIDALENQEEAEFGSFSRVDYVILTIVGVVLPTIALVLAA